MARARTKDQKEIDKIADRIQSVDEVDPFVKVLVYGPNGSGKTRFAASAPDCLIIDVNERGTRSTVGSGASKLEVDTWDDIGHVYWYLKAGNHSFQSVAIDTLTSMHNMAMSFVLDEQDDRDPSRERRTPDKRTWGRTGELMKGMIWAFRNLDMHVVFLAQVREVKDQDTEEIIDRAVDLPAGVRGSATGAVSVLGFMNPRETRVRNKATGKVVTKWVDHMILGPHRDYSALKDRTHQLGPVFRRPTMPAVITAWENRPQEDDNGS